MRFDFIRPIMMPALVASQAQTEEKIHEYILKFFASYNFDVEAINFELLKTEIIKRYPDQKNNFDHYSAEDLKKLFKFQLKKVEVETNKGIIKNFKNSYNENRSQIKRVITDAKNKYSVNQDGQISSKNVLSRLEELKQLYEEQKSEFDRIKTILNFLVSFSATLNTVKLISYGIVVGGFF
ncbi:hypothetical protein [Mycoplasmopsis felifaucium]|uniref:Uncharacterized protein n=1 Tax=Mycoplasmopsis felifaucium TaxID=35768 RepID=A0ABZ2RQ77_9BACT